MTNKWTEFNVNMWGKSAVGDLKHIFIEAPQDEAEQMFFDRFGVSAWRVWCHCCGPDFDPEPCGEPTLWGATLRIRREWDFSRDDCPIIETQPLPEFLARDDVLVIFA